MIQLVTPFPFLLDFSFFAPLLLRLAVAVFLLSNISKSETAPVWYKGVFVLIGISLFVGFGLQVSAAILAISLIASLVSPKTPLPFAATKNEVLLLLVITLSLLVTGAGPFAFDLPL